MSRRQRSGPWFAGGTDGFVRAGTKKVATFLLYPDNHATVEDGIIYFQNVGAVLADIEYIQRIGMDDLSRHVTFMLTLLEARLRKLTWGQWGSNCLHSYPILGSDERREHALSVVILSQEGKAIPSRVIEDIMLVQGVAVCSGCFCNPASGFQMHNGLIDLPAETYEMLKIAWGIEAL
jgi:selenocysteine lyase/cysteine desulfurase